MGALWKSRGFLYGNSTDYNGQLNFIGFLSSPAQPTPQLSGQYTTHTRPIWGDVPGRRLLSYPFSAVTPPYCSAALLQGKLFSGIFLHAARKRIYEFKSARAKPPVPPSYTPGYAYDYLHGRELRSLCVHITAGTDWTVVLTAARSCLVY